MGAKEPSDLFRVNGNRIVTAATTQVTIEIGSTIEKRNEIVIAIENVNVPTEIDTESQRTDGIDEILMQSESASKSEMHVNGNENGIDVMSDKKNANEKGAVTGTVTIETVNMMIVPGVTTGIEDDDENCFIGETKNRICMKIETLKTKKYIFCNLKFRMMDGLDLFCYINKDPFRSFSSFASTITLYT